MTRISPVIRETPKTEVTIKQNPPNFSKNVLCFLVTSILRFALVSYYRLFFCFRAESTFRHFSFLNAPLESLKLVCCQKDF